VAVVQTLNALQTVVVWVVMVAVVMVAMVLVRLER
jgi:hypothetical protein